MNVQQMIMEVKINTFEIMAGKNEKVDFLSDINLMVENQKEENHMLRRRKAGEKINEPILNVETAQENNDQPIIEHPDKKVSRGVKGRPRNIQKVERNKIMNVYFDKETHKTLARIKIEHNFEMKDVTYIAIRKFLDEYMEGNELNEKGVRFIEKKLKEMNG